MDKIADRSHLAMAGIGDVSAECLVGMAIARDSVSDRRLSGWSLHARNPKVLVRGTKSDSTQDGNPCDMVRHHWSGRMVICSNSSPSLDCTFSNNLAGLFALAVGEQFAEAVVSRNSIVHRMSFAAGNTLLTQPESSVFTMKGKSVALI